MSTLQEKAAAAKAVMDKQNPSNTPERSAESRKRIPLNIPMQKLEVPEIPGYHLRWFRGTAARLQQAERAGFVFVQPDEVSLNNSALGGDATKTGNSDMGSRVSVTAGDVDDNGGALRMYLMKQPMEYYLEDQKVSDERNASVADTLTASYRTGTVGGGAPGEKREDVGARYVDKSRTKIPDLFKRKR